MSRRYFSWNRHILNFRSEGDDWWCTSVGIEMCCENFKFFTDDYLKLIASCKVECCLFVSVN